MTAPKHIMHNREIVCTALSKRGWLLLYVPVSMRNDKEVVLAAVRKEGTALRFASETLRADPDVIRAAEQNDPCARAHALFPPPTTSRNKRNRRAFESGIVAYNVFTN